MYAWLLLGIIPLTIHGEVFKPSSGAVRTYEAMDVGATFFNCSIADRGWTYDPRLTAGADRAIKTYLIDYTSLRHARVDSVIRSKIHLNAKAKCRELGELDFNEFTAHRAGPFEVDTKIDMGSNQPEVADYYYAVFNCTVVIARP